MSNDTLENMLNVSAIWLPPYQLPFITDKDYAPYNRDEVMRGILKQLEYLTGQIDKKEPVEIKLLDSRLGSMFPLPKYESHEAAGIDLRAMCTFDDGKATPIIPGKPILLAPEQTVMVGAGFAININDPSLAMMIYPRSGLGANGVVLGNLTGVLDSDYQGHVKIILWNRHTLGSTRPKLIHVGDRIAQAVFTRVQQIRFETVEEFSRVTDRGERGTGSTGVL